MKGTIICSKCRKRMVKFTCTCGNEHCYIATYHNKKHLIVRRDLSGMIFDFDSATSYLLQMNLSGTPVHQDTGEIMEQWLKTKRNQCEAGELAPATLASLESIMRTHVLDFFEGTAIASVDISKLEEFSWSLSNLKGNSKKLVMAYLRNFLRWCSDREIIGKVPKFPKLKVTDAKQAEALTVEEQAEALELIPEKHRPIFAFGMETGLRSSELSALRIEDINLRKGTMTVHRTFSGIKRERSTTKGGHADIVPLSEEALRIAEDAMGNRSGEDYLFINPEPNSVNRHYTYMILRNLWVRVRGRKYDTVKVHELIRHSFCTQLVENTTVSALVAQKLMRHKAMQTTQKYFSYSPENSRSFVNARKKGSEKETNSKLRIVE